VDEVQVDVEEAGRDLVRVPDLVEQALRQLAQLLRLSLNSLSSSGSR
jgi:hypothetical protein